MTFELDTVVPWGRSYSEYLAMFALSQEDLHGHILGCSDGPASFNAVATRHGHRVVSADPLYRYSPAQIHSRIEETARVVADQTRRNAHEFVWTCFDSVDALITARMTAMQEFLADYPAGRHAGRYVDSTLPCLPFGDQQFDLALCSHFLFLYSAQHDLPFHIESLVELRRVSREVRVFPLLELGAVPSRHLTAVVSELADRGCDVQRVPVAYEFQKNGNEMLRIA